MQNADLEVVESQTENKTLAKKKFYLEKTIPVEIEDDDIRPPTPSSKRLHEPESIEEFKTPIIEKEQKDEKVDQDDSFDDEDRTKEELQ